MRHQAISLIETLTSSAKTHETVGSAVKSGTQQQSLGYTKPGGMNQQQLRGIYNKHMEYLPAIIPRIITILTTNNTGTNQQSGEIKHQALGLYQLVMDMFGLKQGFNNLNLSKMEMLASKQMGYMDIWIYGYIHTYTYTYTDTYMYIWKYEAKPKDQKDQHPKTRQVCLALRGLVSTPPDLSPATSGL